MQEDVVWFDITVHYIVLGEHFEGLDNLAKVTQCPLLWERPFAEHQLVQGAPIAILVDEIEVVSSLEHVNILDDEGAALQRGQYVDFIDRALFQLGDLPEFLGLHHLDGHLLLRYQMHCLMHFRVHSLTKLLF